MSLRLEEDGDEIGGTGGAIYTEEGSDTLFEGRAIMQYNLGASGGGLYNRGNTNLRNGAFFRSNRAQVTLQQTRSTIHVALLNRNVFCMTGLLDPKSWEYFIFVIRYFGVYS